ncbi:hypothetical protein [Streptomyces tanashiensis]|uniref:hypothetical protein n=1 Tax=Streptomyces tanashiensis TaxID=67367 RepID=UPI0033DA4DF6
MSDLVIVSACSITISLAEPTGFALRALDALMVALYMRTDMYFVLQELLGCKNLYADSWDYTRYALKRTYASAARRRSIPRHERKPVKRYAAIMPSGRPSLRLHSSAPQAPFSCHCLSTPPRTLWPAPSLET